MEIVVPFGPATVYVVVQVVRPGLSPRCSVPAHAINRERRRKRRGRGGRGCAHRLCFSHTLLLIKRGKIIRRRKRTPSYATDFIYAEGERYRTFFPGVCGGQEEAIFTFPLGVRPPIPSPGRRREEEGGEKGTKKRTCHSVLDTTKRDMCLYSTW